MKHNINSIIEQVSILEIALHNDSNYYEDFLIWKTVVENSDVLQQKRATNFLQVLKQY